MNKPTIEQCQKNERVGEGVACWYPQMGGHSSRCIVVAGMDVDQDGTRDGFDAYVWSDGEFSLADGEEPRVLHHCSATQFIEFGQFVQALIEAKNEPQT